MEFSEERYYKINKILLSNLGLWPHRRTRCARVKPILIHATFIYYIFVQLCTLISSECNMNLLLKVLSSIFPTIIYTLKYSTYYVKATKIQLLMEVVRKDWKEFRRQNDKREIEILHKYARTIHTYTIVFILAVFIGNSAFEFLEAFPIIFDWLMPLNESRPRRVTVLVEYFIDSERYFPLILLHEFIAVLLGSFTVVSTGTITLIYMEHACAMLKIVSFRIEHALEKSVLQYSVAQTERIIYCKIIRAVDLHRRAIKFFDLILSNFSTSYCIMIIVGVASISLNLCRLLQLADIKDLADLFTIITLLLIHFVYMFIANYVGQIITDHSEDIFNTTCNILWYTAPLQSQKMLLFLMHRTIKLVKPVVGKMFVASLEGFATVMYTH
ncbi:uncharacterized protein LOC116845929 [Odontomachus brunneus]|uniref:uncharacterized protein LOC116845929 n=1 Tax=Odontomachus brunneus TaxID=486640 RepID=UPI0013F28BEB|nr:uncharacterized protein LOC116845929 [Odontomachus brunneus]